MYSVSSSTVGPAWTLPIPEDRIILLIFTSGAAKELGMAMLKETSSTANGAAGWERNRLTSPGSTGAISTHTRMPLSYSADLNEVNVHMRHSLALDCYQVPRSWPNWNIALGPQGADFHLPIRQF